MSDSDPSSPLCHRPQSCASMRSMLEPHPIVWEVASPCTEGGVLHSMSPPLPTGSSLRCALVVVVFQMPDHGNVCLGPVWPCIAALLTGGHYRRRSCFSAKVWGSHDMSNCTLQIFPTYIRWFSTFFFCRRQSDLERDASCTFFFFFLC